MDAEMRQLQDINESAVVIDGLAIEMEISCTRIEAEDRSPGKAEGRCAKGKE